MTGAEFIEQMRRSISVKGEPPATDRALAKRLGLSITGLANWKSRQEITASQMARLIKSAEKATEQRTHLSTIRPIVEFFQLSRTKIGAGDNYRIFSIKDSDAKIHPYLNGLKAELEAHHGVYMFYDSRGRALYAGKARSQKLWTELNLAYNRDRGVQNILRVNHPERRLDFRTSDEIRRQIRSANVRLHELAEYVSAYQVADGMICDLESLLIRAFPNDLLNKRMERLSWSVAG